MQIESIDIEYYNYSGFTMHSDDGMVHIKQLPYLSIVQSKVGCYGIKLDNGKEYGTVDGGFFIAPSVATQKITHYLNKDKEEFTARFIFLDIIINKRYHIDDIFDFPVITDAKFSQVFDEDFNEYEAAGDLCDRMRCVWNIIKHLLQISAEKPSYRNGEIYPLIEFIATNYTRHITVSDMAAVLKMSESNLYSVFKKATGVSPGRYLNDYRLSVACNLLLQTDDSVKIIAEKTGITDQFYFSKLFKAKYLVSPQQYRKSNIYRNTTKG